jgi:hypothetical protein
VNARRVALAFAAFSTTAALCGAVHAESPFGSLRRGREAEARPSIARDFPAPGLDVARRLAIAALQDLGLALEAASDEAGTISASRLDAHPLRLTVAIHAKDEATVAASVTTDYAGAPIADPRAAEAFFAAYANALSPLPEID